MAALDFPSSPTDGQVFSAANGVVYVWSSTYSSWLLNSMAGAPSGADFFGRLSGGAVGPAGTYIVFSTVIGNAGGYYSTSTGRFTPPAGRYRLTASFFAASSGAATNIHAVILKNGSTVGEGLNTCDSTHYAQAISECEADANGTDYFQMWVQSDQANTGTGNYWFGAFPLSGVKGPQGDPGPVGPGGTGLTLASEHVLASPSNMMTVTFPVGAKRVDLDYWWTTSPFADLNGTTGIYGMSGASPITTAAYNNFQNYFRADGSSAGSFLSGGTSMSVNGNWAQQHGHINFQRPDAGYGVMSAHALTAGGSRYQLHGSYEGQFAAGTFTGFRLFNTGSVNFAAGSFMRCYVVT